MIGRVALAIAALSALATIAAVAIVAAAFALFLTLVQWLIPAAAAAIVALVALLLIALAGLVLSNRKSAEPQDEPAPPVSIKSQLFSLVKERPLMSLAAAVFAASAAVRHPAITAQLIGVLLKSRRTD